MEKLFRIKKSTAFGIYIFLDLICIGMGMGVPVFCILFGFPVGWYIGRLITVSGKNIARILRQLLVYTIRTSAFTFIIMAILWGRWASVLFDASTDYSTLGIPMILFEPKASFIGWLVLMIFISPFLQLLTTLFASVLTLVIRKPADDQTRVS